MTTKKKTPPALFKKFIVNRKEKIETVKLIPYEYYLFNNKEDIYNYLITLLKNDKQVFLSVEVETILTPNGLTERQNKLINGYFSRYRQVLKSGHCYYDDNTDSINNIKRADDILEYLSCFIAPFKNKKYLCPDLTFNAMNQYDSDIYPSMNDNGDSLIIRYFTTNLKKPWIPVLYRDIDTELPPR